MKEMRVLASFNRYLNPEWLEAIDSTPFMVACRQGRVARTELMDFMVQHYHYARHFTRYLCALLSNIMNDEDRLQLCDNLFEEMGLGELGAEPHSRIYRRMLESFGVDPAKEPVRSETQDLIDTMFALCQDENPLVGLGALFLGAEAIVPHVYSQILGGFLAAGFSRTDLHFFDLHIEGDDEHALTMMKIVEREVARHPTNLAILQFSAEIALAKRQQFFAGIGEKVVPLAKFRRVQDHALQL